MRILKLFFALLTTILFFESAQAEIVGTDTLAAEAQNHYVKITSPTYNRFQNVSFALMYNDGKSLYNLRSCKILSSSKFKGFAINPAVGSFAFLDGRKIKIYSIGRIGFPQKTISIDQSEPVCAAYSHDARFLNVLDTNGIIHVYNTGEKYIQSRQFKIMGEPVSNIVLSYNNYFLSAIQNRSVEVYNYETGELRQKINAPGIVNAVVFNHDNSQMAIACDNGSVIIYNTQDFKEIKRINELFSASDIDYHVDGKYLAVVVSDALIRIINLVDDKEKFDIEFPNGVSQVRFLKDNLEKEDFVFTKQGDVAKGEGKFAYISVKNLLPYYTNRMIDELNARLAEWSKKRPDESIDDYKQRVNETNRMAEAKRIENEIVTRMAGDLVGLSNISIAGYNRANEMLTIQFDNMPDIYLKMDENEASAFSNAKDLVFSDVVYGLTENDKFEIIYATVHNKANGKTYTFNNLGRESLAFLKDNDSMVSIELIQQAGMEDIKLQAMKEEIVNEAKDQNLISDNTEISVKTNVESGVDANGNRIMNYNIDFNYQVNAEYSAKDDFAAGKYKIEQSNAAVSMLKIAQTAFDKDFAQYIKEGKKVLVTITGSADALPINGKIAYDACYGNFEEAPYTSQNELKSMTVSKSTGITQNEQLAFLRAQGVKHYIEEKISAINKMNKDYKFNVEVAEGVGGEYRRIHVRFTFVDAF